MNLKGLLFFLIFPSTIMLILAYSLGIPIHNIFKEFDSVVNLAMYQLGNTIFNFTRTHVGFLLAALICASTAIIISPVRRRYRLLAVLCLLTNVLLILVTGSVGSILSCICGLTAIFFALLNKASFVKTFTSILGIVFLLVLTWIIAPPGVQSYIEKRYEERFVSSTKINVQDRSLLWTRALDYAIQHPEGIGWSLSYGDHTKANAHNDYLAYAIGYGLLGGIIYTSLVVSLLVYFLRNCRTPFKDPSALAIDLAGLGVIVVIFVNSMSDHMTANKWYYLVIWSIVWYSYFCSKRAYNNSTSFSI